MTETDKEIVDEVEAFLARHEATAMSVRPSGLGEIVDDATTDEIDAALAELRTRSNGTGEVGDP